MSDYSLDDMKEIFRADLSGYLEQVSGVAASLVASPLLQAAEIRRLGDESPFSRLADIGHGVRGTSSVVGAKCTAAVGDRLEALAHRGHEALALARLHAARAARIAACCVEVGRELRSISEYEISKDEDSAEWSLTALTASVEEVLSADATALSVPAAFLGDELAEEERAQSRGSDALAANTSAPTRDALELLRQEVAGPTAALQGLFESLARDPSHPTAARAAHHVFGAFRAAVAEAAARGAGSSLGELASIVRELEDATSVGPHETIADLDSVVLRTNRAMDLAGLAPIAVPRRAPSAPAPRPSSAPVALRRRSVAPVAAGELAMAFDVDQPPELQEIFLKEAGLLRSEIVEALVHLVASLEDREALQSLYRAYHTLKGAAATVGLNEISSLAKGLQQRTEDWIETNAPLTAQELGALVELTDVFMAKVGLRGVRGELGDGVGVASVVEGDREVAPSPDAAQTELFDIFVTEAREMLVALQGHLNALANNPTDRSALEHAERLLHTLKGAAATVGQEEARRVAAELQQRVENVLDGNGTSSEAFVQEITLGVAPLFEVAGLKAAPPVHGDPSQMPSEGGQVLSREAASVLGTASNLVAELRTAAFERARAIREELAVLFHRLKGSAAVQGATDVAEALAQLERATEEDARSEGLVDDLQAGLVIVRELLASVGAPKDASGPRREKVVVAVEPELWEAVQQECTVVLEDLDKLLLSLEESAQPKEMLETCANLLHTLKGAVNTGGLSPTGRELHALEDFVELLRAMPILPPLRHVVSLLLAGQESVRRALKDGPKGYVVSDLGRIQRRIETIVRGRAADSTHDIVSTTNDSVSAAQQSNGSHAGASGSYAGAAAASQGSAGSHGDAVSRSSKGRSGAGAATAEDEAVERAFVRVNTERLDSLMNLAGELVVSRSRLLTRVTAMRILQDELHRSQSRLLGTVDAFRDRYEFENLAGKITGASRARPVSTALAATGTDDVVAANDTTRLFSDIELDRYEDIHVLSRSLGEIGNDFEDINRQISTELGSFAEDSDAFSKLVTDIQGEVTRSRMVTLELLFTRVQLPIRDAAQREGKDVRVVTQGADVTIDKTIADALFAPLLHLVRNAVVHGIESPEVRARSSKPARGTIYLSAREQSGQIVIEVRDDGAGLDLDALHARGVARGLVSASTPVDDPAVKQLVFAQGISTKDRAGDVAGRGIGGDVARRTIERLNGEIRVATTRGTGTVFSVTLPLTLAITRALVVRQGHQHYAIPIHFCEHIYDTVDERAVQLVGGVPRIRLDDGFIVVHWLGDLLDVPSSMDQRKGPVLLLRVGDQRMAIQVGTLESQEEIVIKQMGDLLAGHALFSGISIRGAGEMALILDVPSMIEAQGTRSPVAARGARSADDADVRPEPAPAKVEPADQAQRRVRVLFADDSLSVRKVAEHFLVGLGVDVTMAVDGVDALAKLREASFDLVFTDLEMPRMHGYDLIRSIRGSKHTEDVPVVVVSSRSAQKHQARARELGATEYLTKPFTAQSLQQVLSALVRKRP